MGIILVQGRDVIKDIVLIDEHAVQARVDDHRQFVGVSRIVGYAIRDGRCQNMAMAVLVLQAFAIEGRAAGCAADQKAARPHVARGPGEIADALETEHRIVDVEGDHRHIRGRIGCARGDERSHRAGLVDALLKDLAFRILAVIHELIGVLRPIKLADLAENPDLPKQTLHAEGAALVRDDRNHMRTEILVAQERGQNPDEGHGGRDFSPSAVAFRSASKVESGGTTSGSLLRRRAGR